ncbi:MAG: hypothetical protein BGP03_20835 [Pseudonocardia sp. 73-21]|nr:MAG: hypothetical protein BGP03_20835 [Pseudonocardia sp. 73-21]
MPTTSAPTPSAVSRKPRRSSAVGPLPRTSGTSRRARRTAPIPSGTLITKIHRHDAYVLRIPPGAGATTGATGAGHVR